MREFHSYLNRFCPVAMNAQILLQVKFPTSQDRRFFKENDTQLLSPPKTLKMLRLLSVLNYKAVEMYVQCEQASYKKHT